MSTAVTRTHGAKRSTREGPSSSDVALTLALAGLTIVLGFEAGGYFADTTGWAAAGLALALGASVLLSGGPLRRLTRPLLVAASALALLALWTLLSGRWSGAWGRSLIEFDRVLLYLLALLLFAGARSPEWTLRRIPAAFAFAALVLCASALFVRTLPNSWPFALPPTNSRMDYPLGYENALGALAALGLVMSLHLASWRKEHPAIRVLAAAALPVFAAALALTYSRGAPAAAVVGMVAYLILGLSRGTLIAVLAAGVPVALALNGAYGADLLGSDLPRSPAALAEGEDLATLIVWTAAAAAVMSTVLMPLERRLPRVRLSRVKARVVVPAVALVLAAGTGLTLAIAGPDAFESLRDRVLDDSGQQDERRGAERGAGSRVARSIDLESESRPKYWRVSLDAFGDDPFKGSGAGSFAKHWARERTITEDVTEGHSLYLETLAELGLVGAVFLVVALSAMLTPFVAGLRSRQRQLSAAFIAAGATWLVHAALDWDWEMPVLGIWLFAAAGCALASSPSRIRTHRLGRWPARLAVAAGCVLLAVTPGYVALSQARLDKAVEAFVGDRCDDARQHAHDAISAVSSRAEPYELLAYCEARRGEYATALSRMQDAIERDPGNWELLYGLAVVRAAAGLDPRPAARAALRLNPLDDFTQGGVERFASERRRAWRREARTAPLPLIVER